MPSPYTKSPDPKPFDQHVDQHRFGTKEK
jgi:hypothetical protein